MEWSERSALELLRLEQGTGDWAANVKWLEARRDGWKKNHSNQSPQ